MHKSTSISLAPAFGSEHQEELRNVRSSPAPTYSSEPDVHPKGSQKSGLQTNTRAMDELPPIPNSPSSPKQVKSFFNRQGKHSKQRPTVAKQGRVPGAVSETDLESPSILPRKPYSGSPIATQGSLSHGNLVDTLGSGNGNQSATQLSTLIQKDDSGLSYNDWNPQTLPSRHDTEHNIQQRRPSQPVFSSFRAKPRSARGENDSPMLPRIRTPQHPLGADFRELHSDEPKTAPIENARAFEDAASMKKSSRRRDKSAERYEYANDDVSTPLPPSRANNSRDGKRIMENIKRTSTQAAAGINKAGKGFWGRLNRPATANSTHSTQRDNIDINTYVNKVICLPLIEQTRMTRIRARMEEAKDKTEFWMPALPYRCVDYLNMKGIEHEGLYRQSGSVLDIKKWQARFDRELDINLLDEEEDTVDVNTIASILKAWFRELPGELFPKSSQSKIAAANAGAKETPQLLKDELSKLPPFNYYLLFAITCHLALLHSNSDKNKMNYHNLCVCFQPCMGVDAYCFQFLILDWRNCWQGCWTEKDYLIEEYKFMEMRKAQQPTQASAVAERGRFLPDNQNPHSSSTSIEESSYSKLGPPFQGGSRPPTAQSGSRSSSRHRDGPNTTEASLVSTTGDSIKTTLVQTARPTTPPTLSPVTTVSPMRM